MIIAERGPWIVPGLNFPGKVLPFEDLAWKGFEKDLQTISPADIKHKQNGRGAGVFPGVRPKVNPIGEYFHHVHSRINPEGLVIAGTADFVSYFVLPSAQTLVAAALDTGVNIMDPRLTVVVAGATIASILADRYALIKKGFDISLIGCASFATTGKATLSAITEHAINYAAVGLVNPLTVYAGITGNLKFLAEGVAAAPLVLTPWYIIMNLLIGRGEADKVLKPIRKQRQALQQRGRIIWQKVRGNDNDKSFSSAANESDNRMNFDLSTDNLKDSMLFEL